MEISVLRGYVPAGAGAGAGAGYGDGAGAGYGDGYGAGDSAGAGYGDGDGAGAGYGYGYGAGAGAGYGDGDGEYWGAYLASVLASWPASQRARATALQRAGAQLAFWRSDAHGHPVNGGKRDQPAAAIGVVQTAPGPLELCRPGTLHATLRPEKWNGDRWWIVALTGPVISDGEKYGALTRIILGEAKA